MTPKQFRLLYNRNSLELLGVEASEKVVDEAYKSYKALVELTGKDGCLEFEPNSSNHELKVLFNPECNN